MYPMYMVRQKGEDKSVVIEKATFALCRSLAFFLLRAVLISYIRKPGLDLGLYDIYTSNLEFIFFGFKGCLLQYIARVHTYLTSPSGLRLFFRKV